MDRPAAVLQAYAFIAHEMEGQAKARLGSHSAELAGLLHRGGHVLKAQDHLLRFIQSLLADAAACGQIRDDVGSAELARYCVHALTAAGQLTSKAAVRRRVTVTMTGWRSGS